MPKNKKVVPLAPQQPHASVEFTPPSEMSPTEREQFLNENPTRQEVANFVSAYLSTELLPELLAHVNRLYNHNLGLISVCQAVLISQGIISQEDMNTLLENWRKEQEKKAQQPPDGQRPPESTIPGVVK